MNNFNYDLMLSKLKEIAHTTQDENIFLEACMYTLAVSFMKEIKEAKFQSKDSLDETQSK